MATATPLPQLSTRARTARSSMIRDLLHVLEQPHVLSLAGGLPAAGAMPAERLRLALDRAMSKQGRYGATALQYGPPMTNLRHTSGRVS